MSTNEKATLLKTINSSQSVTVNGITYFKLHSEFDGDYTKNCGLLGEEIDKNFYFLRGYDIESIEIDENRTLIIHRVNKDYEPLTVNIGEELGQPTFEFDKENGIITVTYPDGTVATMEGFLVEGKDIRIARDSTLKGNGTIYNPLGVSETEKTGTFAPADEYCDITNGSSIPDTFKKGKGYRIVTKEKIDYFGRLYPLKATEIIQGKLAEEASQWRIPTKDDWDDLLNAFECEENRNHSATTVGYFGKDAGAALKSTGVYKEVIGDGDGLWKEHEVAEWEAPVEGEDLAGISIFPLGRCAARNEMMGDIDYDAEGLGKFASFWTNTKDAQGNGLAKEFVFNTRQSRQSSIGEDAKLSLRLVKDYAFSNYSAVENILGHPYPCELVCGNHTEDFPYTKVWTSINVYDSDPILSGITSQEWSAVTDSDRGVKEIFFINEWDGQNWVKSPLGEGDSIVILDYKKGAVSEYYYWEPSADTYVKISEEQAKAMGIEFEEMNEMPYGPTPTGVHLVQEPKELPYHEWRLINGELVDTVDAVKKEILKEIEEIDKKVEILSAVTVSEIDRLDGRIEQEQDWREQADANLQALLEAEQGFREAADTAIGKRIDQEIVWREQAEANLQTLIETEQGFRETADKALGERIDQETAWREQADTDLNTRVDAETKWREEADGKLQKELNDEIARAKAAEEAEAEERKSQDIATVDYVIDINTDAEVVRNNGDKAITITADFNFGEF